MNTNEWWTIPWFVSANVTKRSLNSRVSIRSIYHCLWELFLSELQSTLPVGWEISLASCGHQRIWHIEYRCGKTANLSCSGCKRRWILITWKRQRSSHRMCHGRTHCTFAFPSPSKISRHQSYGKPSLPSTQVETVDPSTFHVRNLCMPWFYLIVKWKERRYANLLHQWAGVSYFFPKSACKAACSHVASKNLQYLLPIKLDGSHFAGGPFFGMLQPIKHIDVEHGVAESPRMTQIERLKLLNATLTAGTTKILRADTSLHFGIAGTSCFTVAKIYGNFLCLK